MRSQVVDTPDFFMRLRLMHRNQRHQSKCVGVAINVLESATRNDSVTSNPPPQVGAMVISSSFHKERQRPLGVTSLGQRYVCFQLVGKSIHRHWAIDWFVPWIPSLERRESNRPRARTDRLAAKPCGVARENGRHSNQHSIRLPTNVQAS